MSNNIYTPVDKTEDSVMNDNSKENILGKSEDRDFLEEEQFNNNDPFEAPSLAKSGNFIDVHENQRSKMSMIPWWLWLILALVVLAMLLGVFFSKSTSDTVKSIGLINTPTAVQGASIPLVMPPTPNGSPSSSSSVISKNTDSPTKININTSIPSNDISKVSESTPTPTAVVTPVSAVKNAMVNTPSIPLLTVKKTSPTTNSTVCDINSLSVDVQFLTASSTLTAPSIKSLNSMAKTLNQCLTLNIEVAGHTDSAGHAERHLGLSQRRADSVVNVLIKAGVSKQRLLAKGYGSTKPIANNTTEEGRLKNRRVEFNIR